MLWLVMDQNPVLDSLPQGCKAINQAEQLGTARAVSQHYQI